MAWRRLWGRSYQLEACLLVCYSTKVRGVAQPGSALAWGARGRRFKSDHPDHSESLFHLEGDTCMFCPSCGREDVQGSTYCSQCGTRLDSESTDEVRRPTSARATQGRILAFDDEESTGIISGDNGNRYSFIIQEWRSQTRPRSGKYVDSVPEDHEARDIYELTEPPAGTRTDPTTVAGSKSKVAAGLFAIFLGWLGIHKFYLGYTVPGVILLVAGLLGLVFFLPAVTAAIIGIIEGILYLTKSDEEFHSAYVQGKRDWF